MEIPFDWAHYQLRASCFRT